MKALSIMVGAILLLSSCSRLPMLHNTGEYTIKERKGNTTRFYEVRGKYILVSDTLEENDKILIYVIKDKAPKKQKQNNPDDLITISTSRYTFQ